MALDIKLKSIEERKAFYKVQIKESEKALNRLEKFRVDLPNSLDEKELITRFTKFLLDEINLYYDDMNPIKVLFTELMWGFMDSIKSKTLDSLQINTNLWLNLLYNHRDKITGVNLLPPKEV